MQTMTARQRRNRLGDALRRVQRGETLIIMVRGKPVGRLTPYALDAGPAETGRPMDEAWKEIEAALRRSRPRLSTWSAAEDASRRRS